MGLQGCVWALSHPCMELRCCTAARVALRRRWAPCRGAHGGLLCQLLVPCSLKPLARVLLPNGITHISANDLSCALIRGAGRAVGPGAVPVRLWGVPWAAPGMLCVSFGAAAPAGRPRPHSFPVPPICGEGCSCRGGLAGLRAAFARARNGFGVLLPLAEHTAGVQQRLPVPPPRGRGCAGGPWAVRLRSQPTARHRCWGCSAFPHPGAVLSTAAAAPI